MPGIVGFIQPHWNEQCDSSLTKMLDQMNGESFDERGSCKLPSAGVGLGWVNREKSFATNFPVWNNTRDVCLLFSGELFSDAHSSDPEYADYILRLYEKDGPDFVSQLNGTFSGALVDLKKQETIIFNDRYGLNRLYYYQSPQGLFFASEAKPLLHIFPGLRELDVPSLGEWFSCGCVLQNRTLFKNLAILPPASNWRIGSGASIRRQTYFQPEIWQNQPRLSAAAYVEELHEIFPRVVSRYLNGSQPVGMSLTGGLDGRMIMAWAGHSRSVPCYTFNGPYHDCADLIIGRRVAAACGQTHQTIQVGQEFLSSFPSLAEKTVAVSSGEMDVSGAVEIYANAFAREIAPIRITGNYGSEIVRGNVAFKPSSFAPGLFAGELARNVEQAAHTYNAERKGDRLAFIAFKQVPWHHHARLATEQSQIIMRSPFLDNDIVSLLFRAPDEMRSAFAPSFRLISAGNGSLSRIPTDRGVVYPPIPGITRLRKQFEEFMIKLEYAFDYGMPQPFAACVGRHLPRWGEHLFLGRQKFYHYRTWYQHELAPYLREILLDPKTKTRPWYEAGFVEKMVEGHTSGARNYTSEIHRVLSLELIQRHLLNQ